MAGFQERTFLVPGVLCSCCFFLAVVPLNSQAPTPCRFSETDHCKLWWWVMLYSDEGDGHPGHPGHLGGDGHLRSASGGGKRGAIALASERGDASRIHVSREQATQVRHSSVCGSRPLMA